MMERINPPPSSSAPLTRVPRRPFVSFCFLFCLIPLYLKLPWRPSPSQGRLSKSSRLSFRRTSHDSMRSQSYPPPTKPGPIPAVSSPSSSLSWPPSSFSMISANTSGAGPTTSSVSMLKIRPPWTLTSTWSLTCPADVSLNASLSLYPPHEH